MRFSTSLSFAILVTMTSSTAFSLRPHYNSPTLTSQLPSHTLPLRTFHSPTLTLRGGKTSHSVSTTANDTSESHKHILTPVINGLISLWAAGGVVMILGRAMKRIVPIALEPFGKGAVPLSSFQWVYV